MSRARRSRRDKRKNSHYRCPPRKLGGARAWTSSKLSGKVNLSGIALIPSRPDRPLKRSVAFRMIRKARRSTEVNVGNLHYKQLTTVVLDPDKQDLHSMIIYAAWLDYFQLNPSRARVGPDILIRLVTLSKRELRMKCTTSHRLVLGRVFRTLSACADLKRVRPFKE